MDDTNIQYLVSLLGPDLVCIRSVLSPYVRSVLSPYVRSVLGTGILFVLDPYWVDVRPILRGRGGGLWVQIMENEFKCLTDKGVSKVVILVKSL